MAEACHHCAAENERAGWWQNKLYWVLAVYAAVLLFGGYLPLVDRLSVALWSYIKMIAWPITLGLLIGGVIDWLVPREYISLLLAGKKKRTVFYAVAAGFAMSACSHGILALAIQLYKKGASPPAVVAFLLASPWANLPLTILMFGFFGWRALVIVLGAIVVALITGSIYRLLEDRAWIETNPNTVTLEEGFSLANDLKIRVSSLEFGWRPLIRAVRSIWEGTVSLANMVLWWILLGMLLASLASAYIPSGFMHQYMGATLLGLLVTLILATVIEICSEGSAPLAFEIYRQTGALGNSFVFLLAGVVTDYTEIGLLWTNIGWRTAVWLPIITVPQVILLGILFNTFLK